jgi:hypothetical protein
MISSRYLREPSLPPEGSRAFAITRIALAEDQAVSDVSQHCRQSEACVAQVHTPDDTVVGRLPAISSRISGSGDTSAPNL